MNYLLNLFGDFVLTLKYSLDNNKKKFEKMTEHLACTVENISKALDPCAFIQDHCSDPEKSSQFCYNLYYCVFNQSNFAFTFAIVKKNISFDNSFILGDLFPCSFLLAFFHSGNLPIPSIIKTLEEVESFRNTCWSHTRCFF